MLVSEWQELTFQTKIKPSIIQTDSTHIYLLTSNSVYTHPLQSPSKATTSHKYFLFLSFLLTFFFSSHCCSSHMIAHAQPPPPFLIRHLYPSKYCNCFSLIAPLLFFRIIMTASTASIFSNSIRAMATKTGALPNPATQCTAIVAEASDD